MTKAIIRILAIGSLLLAGPACGQDAGYLKTTLYQPPSLGVSLRAEHAFDPSATHYRARFLGGGGAGEGAESNSEARVSAGSPGGSGAEGMTGEKLLLIPTSRTIKLAVGHGAEGKLPRHGVNADDGGSSWLKDEDNGTYWATGGSGGQMETSDVPPYASSNSNGRAGIATDPQGRIIGAGTRGGIAMIFNVGGAMMAFADGGASSTRGRGFEGRRITGPGAQEGVDSQGPGAGGGGGVSIDRGAVRGGHGGPGEVEIVEYVVAH